MKLAFFNGFIAWLLFNAVVLGLFALRGHLRTRRLRMRAQRVELIARPDHAGTALRLLPPPSTHAS